MTEGGEERFLRAIADRLPAACLEEVYLFPAMHQGGVEAGVAVIAATAAGPATATDAGADAGAVAATSAGADAGADLGADAGPDTDRRLAVYRAVYRWWRKGPERGRWEIDVTEEAAAPASAVAAVVSGVHRRAGMEGEPARLSGDDVRRRLGEGERTSSAPRHAGDGGAPVPTAPGQP